MSFISYKSFMKLLIVSLFISASCLATAFAKNNQFEVSYLEGTNKVEQALEVWLKTSNEIELVTSIINQEFMLDKPLELVFGAEDGPLFDSGINKIHIPYSFLTEIQERFHNAKYLVDTGITAKNASMDALMHTIFHELAHALIFQFDLPVLGKEEDAVDGLASVLLIEYLDEGQEVVLTAADLFDLESQDVTEYQAEDYWDEHSLDIQRYYSSMCHVYGSSPKAYSQIKKEQKFSEEKAENCIGDYEVLVNSWLTLLDPFLRKQSD